MELKDLSLDCELDTMGREFLIDHLLLIGLHSSEEKLWEKIIIDAEGQELKDSKISGLIATSEMYRSSARKNSLVHRVESKPEAGGSDRQRDPSRKRIGLVCFKCGDEGHFKSD